MSYNNKDRPISKVNPIQTTNNTEITSFVDPIVSHNLSGPSINQSFNLCSLAKSGVYINTSNVMNINLSNPNNNSASNLIQNLSQSNVVMPTSTAGFIQTAGSTPKAVLQLSDNRFVQIAQNPGLGNQQIGNTIFVQMPYRLVDQNIQNNNPNLMNKKLLVKPVIDNNQIQFGYNKLIASGTNNMMVSNQNFIHSANNVIFNAAPVQSINNSNISINPSQMINCQSLTTPTAMVDASNKNYSVNEQQLNNLLANTANFITAPSTNIIPLEKYQEISDMIHNKALLSKPGSNEDHVLVEFRLNNQKFQLRMTKTQKSDMEKLLVSVNNHQRQMEILQVYQAEQRKTVPHRANVVLNQQQTNFINNTSKQLISPSCAVTNAIKPATSISSTSSNNSSSINNGLITNKAQLSNVLPMNSMFVTVPANTSTAQPLLNTGYFIDNSSITTSNNNNNSQFNSPQQKPIAITPAGSPAIISNSNPTNGLVINSRLSSPQSSILPNNNTGHTNMLRKNFKRASPLIKHSLCPATLAPASTASSHTTQTATSTITSSVAFTTISVTSSSASTSQPMSLPPTLSSSAAFYLPFPNANSNNDMKPARARRYNNMRRVVYEDHQLVVKPDTHTPFSRDDDTDVARRLLPYHVLDETKDEHPVCQKEVDRILNDSFNLLEKRIQNIKRISASIFINETLNHRRIENLIIKRMRLDLEKDVVDREKSSQQSYFINKSNLIPLLFDEKGNAYPSCKVEQQIKPDIPLQNNNATHKIKEEPEQIPYNLEHKIEIFDVSSDEDRHSNKSDDKLPFLIDEIFDGGHSKVDKSLISLSSSSSYSADTEVNNIRMSLQQSINNVKLELASNQLIKHQQSADGVSDQTIPAVTEDEEEEDETPESNDEDDDNDPDNNHNNSMYNIQDISMDSFDNPFFQSWNSDMDNETSEILSNKPDSTIINNQTIISSHEVSDNNNNNQQSEDPDVDAAIRSILF